MVAQSWNVIVRKKSGKNEKHCVFAPNSTNARIQLELRGYIVVTVKEGHLFQNVNRSAEFKKL